MERVRLELELTTPAFLAGSNQAQAEWRAASVRGQLRWWLRAVAGRDHDLEATRRLEAEIFGSPERRSPLTVRVAARPPGAPTGRKPQFRETWSAEALADLLGQAEDEATLSRLEIVRGGHKISTNTLAYLAYGCLDHNGYLVEAKKDQSGRDALLAGASATLTLQWRPREMPHVDYLRRALTAWLHLGGIGARSRNGWGSLQVTADPDGFLGEEGTAAPTRESLTRTAAGLLGPAPAQLVGDPPEWTAFSGASRVLVGKGDFPSWEKALGHAGACLVAYRRRYGIEGDPRNGSGGARDYAWAKDPRRAPAPPDRGGFGLPLPFGKDPHLTWVKDRRASPLLLHIAPLAGGRYVSVWTHLPARFLPEGKDLDWTFPGGRRQFAVTAEQRGIVDSFLDTFRDLDRLEEVTR